ncbi:hypothetical protein F0562_029223 [Nyssa sinensis]|uniref:Protein kinase domain-containing protein n=1 Tax=Nyssa sinensis TaxID=561372 RepID=A0A5J5B0G8_9ASTE|nr:hypothetical protein F0562_029223 [Nyssa sinensis]
MMNLNSIMKGVSKLFLFAFLGGFALAVVVHAQQDQPAGFISIDCGIPENSNYTDENTGIYYSSDAGFIDSGESKIISPEFRTYSPARQFLNVKSFPEGKRNCYTLRPAHVTGNTYLVRAWFMYGNYDLKNQTSQFGLYIGVDFWDNVTVEDSMSYQWKEIIHVPPKDYINVCLVNIGLGAPFITALELRPLNKSMYETQSGSLNLFTRYDMGSTTNQLVRYKDDIYDRIWMDFNLDGTTTISGSSTFPAEYIDTLSDPPHIVMSTANTPNASDSLYYSWVPDNPTDQFYIYLHFTEVQVLKANESRAFLIYLNGELWYSEPVIPSNLTTTTIYGSITAPKFEISINKTSNSTLPPIINAIELYNVRQLNSPTDEKDGFISIDCGIPENSNYADEETGIYYSSDAGFIDSGESKIISPEFRTYSPARQFLNVKSFPEGKRNCYTLRPAHVTGNTYLVRAWFMYGNYDLKNQTSQFGLYIGVDFWDNVTVEDSMSYQWKEIIHVPSKDYINVCLVNIGLGTPFITALELRPLNKSMYETQSGSLNLFTRYDMGSTTNQLIRYKDDIYDRIWRDFNLDGTTTISGSSTFPAEYIDTLSDPPHIVMSTANTPNASDSLYYSWVPDNPTDQFYIYLHFTEVQVLKANESRAFLIYLNGELWYSEPVIPRNLTTTTIYGSITAPKFEISINKTSNSTLQPIINAIELYNVRQLNSPTDEKDVAAIMSIKSIYGLKRNWQGDPCAPRAFVIDGVGEDTNPRPAGKDENTNSSQSAPWKIIVPVVVLSVLLTATFAFLWVIKRRKQVKKVDIETNRKDGTLEEKKKQFTYFEVLNITNNFERVIGKGGFGIVYHGYIGHTQVAVKMLSPSSTQGYNEFQAEANLLISVHHKNLTSLVGYCNEGTNMGIIYEFMANGDLRSHLSDRNPKVLMWEDRLQIAVDAAQGLDYLHHGCKPPIIHRDVKCANILLNEKFQAKLADFGLSRVFPTEGDTHVSTKVAGTPGYLDPEYSTSNRLTKKSDVYSFGIVLLEIITNRPAISKGPDKTHISQWVRSRIENGDVENIVDPRLHGDIDVNSVWKAVELAMACVSHTSTKRPTMNYVVNELQECLATKITCHEMELKDPIGVISMNVESEVLVPLAR